mgnify:CR=1 FL=1
MSSNQDVIENLQKINQRLMAQVVELEQDLDAVQDYINKQATEHESIKTILFASEERLRSVIASAPIILYAIDDQGIVTFAEGKGLQKSGLDTSKLVGRSFIDFFPGINQIKDDVTRVLSGESFDTVIDIEDLWIEIRYSPIRKSDDSVSGGVCIARDITDIIHARTDKIEKEKLKSVLEMAGAVSHEINQPLQMLATNLELLELHTKKPQIKDIIRAMDNALSRMIKITSRLSTITKYETMTYTDSTNIIDLYKASR